MKQPVLNVNGKRFKVHSIDWYRDGRICSITVWMNGKSKTIFNDNPSIFKYGIVFDGETEDSYSQHYMLDLSQEGLITL
ncbi:hypothetical protein QQ991_03100 [Weizmannia coagulans]|nr:MULTISPECIES: hypothetical protein [Heyndrickxia]APB37953.1 hypothetical protein BIZ35_15100 [Heyndrickxia coagulans]ATW84536.1 hypothetical protein CIW84_17025 [Heyndrickxia coagulans]KGB30174.1 hypothetical protein IE89_06675 [Heyndrickxia coagulans]KXT21110.1 hypothetical protein UZ35_05920 [Heyndrickxia coagulans]MCR4445427.1 hypothetical protein [Heyndrickxia coagulans]